MPKLIKNSAAQENSWVTIADQEGLAKADLANGKYLVPLELWQQNTSSPIQYSFLKEMMWASGQHS